MLILQSDRKTIPTTPRVIQFFFAMTESDYKLHSDHINTLVEDFLKVRRTSTVRPFPVVIQFAYVSVPRKVKITTADKIAKEDEWDELVGKGRRNLGQLVHLTVEGNAGTDGQPFKVYGIIDEPR